jgi:ABC-type branched-subunit amino acid transport system substrate-binding protein
VPAPKKLVRVEPGEAAAAAAPGSAGFVEEPVGEELPPVAGEPVALEPVGAPPAEPVVVYSAGAKVACVLPLTGADRTVGEAMLRGIRLVFGDGNPQVIFRDTGSDPEFARSLFAELGGDADVLLTIAPAPSGEARALAGSAERAAVPLLLVSPTTVPNSRYVRRVAPPAPGGEFAYRYTEQYGTPPDSTTGQAYEAARLAQHALQIAPVSRAEVLSRIAAARGAQTGHHIGSAPAQGGATGSAS